MVYFTFNMLKSLLFHACSVKILQFLYKTTGKNVNNKTCMGRVYEQGVCRVYPTVGVGVPGTAPPVTMIKISGWKRFGWRLGQTLIFYNKA